MSLLESMRSGTDSTFMQLVFGAVVISFVFWGVGMDGDLQTVAKVNGEPITDREFAQAFRRAEMGMEESRQQALSEDERAQLRERVIEDLVRRHALLHEAQRLGLEVSSAEIANVILDIEYFRDADGRHSQKIYRQHLRRMGTTPADFEEDIREDLLLQKLQGLMRLGASVSEPMIQRTFVDNETKLDISYVRIAPRAFRDDVDPSDAELATFVEENADGIQARYDRDFSLKYDNGEKVELSMIRLEVADDGLILADLEPRLEEVVAAIDAGELTFDEAARKWSEDVSAADGGELGELDISQLSDKVVAALDGVEPGSHTEVVVTARDVRVYKVHGRTPARVIPLDEVRSDIALELLREQEAPVLAAAFAEDELLPAWTEAGEAPAELLAGHDLRATSTGLIPAGSTGGGPLQPPASLIKAARQAEEGTVLSEVFEKGGTLYVGQLTDRVDADMSEFEERYDAIAEQALLMRRAEFVEGWVDAVVASADIQR